MTRREWTIADGLTPAQARMMIALEGGPRVYNGRERPVIEALERRGLVDVDWDADLDSQKGRLRWRITVTARGAEQS